MSFRRRLALRMALLCSVVLALAGLAIERGARQALQDSLDSALAGIARSEAASAFDTAGGKLHLHDSPTHVAQVVDATGRVLLRSRNLAAPLAPTGAGYHDQGPDRVLSQPLNADLTLMVALPRAPMEESLRRLRLLILASVGGAAVAAWIASLALSRRLTAPLLQMAEAARAVDRDHPERRLPLPSPDEELRTLGEAFNRALDDLEKALGAQRRFVADASHELRTPLTNLTGALEVALRRERTAEEYRETVAGALAESRRMATLVEDLLTLSRARAGQLPLQLAEVDLLQVATEAVAAAEPRARAAGVRLELQGEPALVRADARRLRQVVDVLLDNAVRHGGSGRWAAVRVAGTRVSVEDSGPGLGPADRERLFERFYRGDPSRSRDTGGAGLGLAIARTLVEAHGGELHAGASASGGAEFWFEIPRGSRPPDAED